MIPLVGLYFPFYDSFPLTGLINSLNHSIIACIPCSLRFVDNQLVINIVMTLFYCLPLIKLTICSQFHFCGFQWSQRKLFRWMLHSKFRYNICTLYFGELSMCNKITGTWNLEMIRHCCNIVKRNRYSSRLSLRVTQITLSTIW